MKPGILIVLLSIFLWAPAVRAQESPASREEILRLFDTMQTREMTQQMLESMADQVRAQVRSMLTQRAAGVPQDFLARIDSLLDQMLTAYPMQEMLEDMIPIYQRHLTSADVSAMIAFYGTPTGQKVIREMPAIAAESAQVSQPRIRKIMEDFNQKVQQTIREMIEQSTGQPAQ